MSTNTLLGILMATILFSMSGTAAEEITLKEFKVTLGKHWKALTDKQKEESGMDAVWVNPKTKRPNAAFRSSELEKSVSSEADGMAASAKTQPEVIKVLSDRKVELKTGGVARIVSLEINARMEKLEIKSPMIFHSIYLPTKDGKSVTFKLQCSKRDLKDLKKDFESAVLGKLVEKSKDAQADVEPAAKPKLKTGSKKKAKAGSK